MTGVRTRGWALSWPRGETAVTTDRKPERLPNDVVTPRRTPHATAQRDSQVSTDVCPRCSESVNLALIKGCLRCMNCGFKWDCNGW